MTATDELRALLDEHGVEYSAEDGKTAWATRWEFGHSSALFTEYDDDKCVFVTSGYTWTPERAIAATLGAGECEWELEHSGTLYDKWRCSECKFLFVEPRCDQGYTDLVPNYCPNCGRKVER